MKRILFLVYLLSSLLYCHAELEITLNIETPGSLSSMIASSKKSQITSLTLSGKLNSSENQTSQPANAILESLEITENSGNTIKYEFSNQTYPQELTNDEKQLFAID